MENSDYKPDLNEVLEENKKLKIENKKLNRQLTLAQDNMIKYKSVSSAKENLSAVIAAEKSKQEKQLQVIMDNSPSIVILLDSTMNIVLSTQSFLDVTGMSGLGFLHHKSFREVFSAFTDDTWLERMESIFIKTLKTNEIQSFDDKLCFSASKNARDYAVNVVPFESGDEKIDGVLVSFHDITERIEMENTIKDALSKATAASKAKSDFLANMSHEIRTPMNAIIGMTNIGMTASVLEQKDYSLSKINDASRHLLGIINDILDMSKIEAGKYELSEVEFDFEAMFEQVANVVNYRVEEMKHEFAISIDKAIPQILIGDNQRLAQVITNLLGNAIKFTPEKGKIDIKTFFLGEEDGVCTIKIVVSDSGIGIHPEQQSDLFQAFVQAEAHTSRKFGGTGLGLPISKSIITLMGGDIWVDSEPGNGSDFTFTIKLKRGEVKKQISVAKEDETSGDISGIFRGHRVLLVEDVDINREILMTLLEPTLLEIDCAVSGTEAVRKFSETPESFDIILMDIQMPEMDGYEATRTIRALNAPNASTVPIIAITANVFKEDIDNCLNAGMNGHIGKPFDFDEVLDNLKEFIR